MAGNSLTCLGVADGLPSSERNHSAYLYRFPKGSVLVDCGEPLTRAYRLSGLDNNLFDRIFISHLHCDHIGGFFMFMQGLWLENRTKNLKVHLPGNGIEPIRKILDAAMIFNEVLPFRLEFKKLSARRAESFNGIRVTPFPTTHLESTRQQFQKRYPQPFEAFSFLIEGGGVRIAHSGDLGAPEDLEPLLKKPVDLLVCELAHFEPEDLFRFLCGRAIKRIALVHLGRPHWTKRNRIPAIAKKYLRVPITIASDGETIPI